MRLPPPLNFIGGRTRPSGSGIPRSRLGRKQDAFSWTVPERQWALPWGDSKNFARFRPNTRNPCFSLKSFLGAATSCWPSLPDGSPEPELLPGDTEAPRSRVHPSRSPEESGLPGLLHGRRDPRPRLTQEGRAPQSGCGTRGRLPEGSARRTPEAGPGAPPHSPELGLHLPPGWLLGQPEAGLRAATGLGASRTRLSSPGAPGAPSILK